MSKRRAVATAQRRREREKWQRVYTSLGMEWPAVKAEGQELGGLFDQAADEQAEDDADETLFAALWTTTGRVD